MKKTKQKSKSKSIRNQPLKKLRHIRVQAFDINKFIIDRSDQPEPIVDVIVNVTAESSDIACKRAIQKVKKIIHSGWPEEDISIIGEWSAKVSAISKIKID